MKRNLLSPLFIHISLLVLGLHTATAQANNMLDVSCESPPPVHCQNGNCTSKLAERGNITDPRTGREYFLDYPCDLKPGEDIVFILNIHGAGSIANWQRHYFPIMDYKEEYRLVVATPTAEGSGAMGNGPGIRMWMSDVDDTHLQNISNQVIDAFGAENIMSFWLAGHSQGGITARRLVCTEFFRDKVDGMLSLSGGRIGNARIVDRFGPPQADGSPPPARPRTIGAESLPNCDFSHIYTTGEHEIIALPETSPWADKYRCQQRRHSEIVDTEPGWVTDSGRSGYPVWGMDARPGTADVVEYIDCMDGRVVADVVRLDKGHTEGLEPVTVPQ
ncbi:MAG: alpha/beta hydrolase [Pseudomonadales bacterium]|nr:alpha/beta hydrolase [Pseudomonadales bacterium]